jgi:hypothetical protein
MWALCTQLEMFNLVHFLMRTVLRTSTYRPTLRPRIMMWVSIFLILYKPIQSLDCASKRFVLRRDKFDNMELSLSKKVLNFSIIICVSLIATINRIVIKYISGHDSTSAFSRRNANYFACFFWIATTRINYFYTWLLTIQKKQAKYFAFRQEKAPVESGLILHQSWLISLRALKASTCMSKVFRSYFLNSLCFGITDWKLDSHI